MSFKFKDVHHFYNPSSPLAVTALNNINVEVKDHEFLVIVGHTGSGKSTLVQHLNGLLTPSSGTITLDELFTIQKKHNSGKVLKALRQRFGLVFQFPETQLFETSIIKDVAFGPKNFKLSDELAKAAAKKALALVGIDESYYQRSPLELSGGEKRKIAIAGILAMEPTTLVVDEPTSGLDSKSSLELM
jgi:energy-coupling factor transport system ATP-binding protein